MKMLSDSDKAVATAAMTLIYLAASRLPVTSFIYYYVYLSGS